MNVRPIQLLLVEDSPTDVELTREALEDAKIANELHHVEDGEQAMAYLRREPPFTNQPRPDVVILDLNLLYHYHFHPASHPLHQTSRP